MAKTDAFETDILELIFNNTNIANLGDGTGVQGSGTPGSLYVRLCTTAPTDSAIGTETTYTNYVQYGVAVARSGSGWTVSGNQVSNAAAITFATCGVTGATLTHFEIWNNNTNATLSERLFWGALDSSLGVTNGVTPEFAI